MIITNRKFIGKASQGEHNANCLTTAEPMYKLSIISAAGSGFIFKLQSGSMVSPTPIATDNKVFSGPNIFSKMAINNKVIIKGIAFFNAILLNSCNFLCCSFVKIPSFFY